MNELLRDNEASELMYEAQNMTNGVLALLYSLPFTVIVFKLLRDRFIMSYNQKHQILYFYITIFAMIFFRFVSYIIYFFWSQNEIKEMNSPEIESGGLRMAYYVSFIATNSLSLPIFFSLTCLTSYSWYRMHLFHVNNTPEVKKKLLLCKNIMIALNIICFLSFLIPTFIGPFVMPIEDVGSFFYIYHRFLLFFLCFLGALFMYIFGSNLWKMITFLKKSSASKVSDLATRFQILLGTVFTCFIIRGIIIFVKIIIFFMNGRTLEAILMDKYDDDKKKKLTYACFTISYYFLLEWIPVCLFIYIIKPFKRKDTEDQDEVSINRGPSFEAVALF